MSDRFISNPYETSFAEVDPAGTDQLGQWMSECVTRIRRGVGDPKKYIGDMGFDAYTGLGGIYYALAKCGDVAMDPKNTRFIAEVVALGNDFISHQDVDHHYLTGSFGAVCVSAGENDLLPGRDLQRILNALEKEENADELFVGRAGWLAAVLYQKEDVQRNLEPMVRRMIEVVVSSGRRLSKRVQKEYASVPPLLFRYHGTIYVGAAHGLAGIFTVLLAYHKLMDEPTKKLVVDSSRWLLAQQDDHGNFPSSMFKQSRRSSNELVHWCHGATGVAQLAMKLFLVDGRQEDLHVADRALDCIWTRGVLRKGNGLCHGVAGSGYPFLLMYRLTGCERVDCLQKATCFAAMTCDERVARHQRTPDAPSSLFEGVAGAVAFIADLRHPRHAEFPFLPIFKEFAHTL